MSINPWKHSRSSAILSIALCCTTNLLAQAGTQGTIAITVTDPTNAGVPGAVLELTSVSTNAVRHSKTEGKGTFSFVGLPIGTYTLSVTRQGLRRRFWSLWWCRHHRRRRCL